MGIERPLPLELFLMSPLGVLIALLNEGDPGTPAAPQAPAGGDGGTPEPPLKSRLGVLPEGTPLVVMGATDFRLG